MLSIVRVCIFFCSHTVHKWFRSKFFLFSHKYTDRFGQFFRHYSQCGSFVRVFAYIYFFFVPTVRVWLSFFLTKSIHCLLHWGQFFGHLGLLAFFFHARFFFFCVCRCTSMVCVCVPLLHWCVMCTFKQIYCLTEVFSSLFSTAHTL